MCRVVPAAEEGVEAQSPARPLLEREGTAQLVIVVAALLAVLIAREYSKLYYGNIVDDAATSLQYAKNLALGNGLVFNVGERVEGYTNFLWVVLEAVLFVIAKAASVNVIPLLLALSLLLLAGCVGLVGVLSLRLGGGLLLPTAFAVALVVGDNSFTCWAVFGLETHLLGFCFLLALWFSSRPHPLRWLRVGAALACAHLTRPDAGLFCAVLIASECVEVGRAALGWRRRGSPAALKAASSETAKMLLVWLGVYGVYFAWRYHYYGLPFPNTYYLKLGGPIDAWARGRDYVQSFFGERWYLPLLALLALLGLRDRTVRTLVVYLTLHTLYVAYVGGDFFSGHRFFVPEIPLFAVAAAVGLGHVARSLGRYEAVLARVGLSSAWVAGVSTALMGTGSVLLWQSGRAEGPLKQEIFAWRDNLRDNRKLMKWLEQKAPPGASIATCLIGHTGFFAGLHVIDLCGVIDPVVAHRSVRGFGKGKAGHEKTASVVETLAKRPTYIVDGYLHTEFWSRGYYLTADPPAGSQSEVWALDLLAERNERVKPARVGFDTGLQRWQKSGDAFTDSPAHGNRPGQGSMRGAVGGFLNSFHPASGDRATGTIRSPEFSIVGDRITLRVAGGIDRERLRASLIVEGRRVFSETGRGNDSFTRREWDTKALRGKQASLEIVDQVADKWGYIAVDELEQWVPQASTPSAEPVQTSQL
jgi:hypothetical protein